MASLLALVACASQGTLTTPTWQRSGLGGAVRPEMGPPQPGMAAPEFDLPARDGARATLSSLRGAWVVLHFTASWCPYCDAEVEHLGEIARAYAGRDVRVVLVDVKDPAAVWQPYVESHVAKEVLALHDVDGKTATLYAPPRAQPSFVDRSQVVLDSTLLVDPRGTIRLFLLPDTAHFDPTFRAVRAELDRMLAEAPPPVLTPEDVARVTLATRGSSVLVGLRIAPGYHVMSDRPTAPNYIATRVEVSAPGLELGEPRFPRAEPYAIGDGTSIATFQGDVEVDVPCRAIPAGATPVTATVRYQACTESRCLFPTTRTTEATLTFAAPRSKEEEKP
jgi:peroxiredoxin